MKGIFLGTTLVAFFLAISGCATTDKTLQERDLHPLTRADLEDLYSRDRIVNGRAAGGATGTGTYTSDGVAELDFGNGPHKGSWRITEGKFCTQYPTLRNGAERCFTQYKIGDNKYQNFNPDGSLNATFSYKN